MKRIHGQKPLWSPGAWQEYLSAAWLLARCPHVHISRASSGEAAAGRPRTPAPGLASCKFLLVTVPLSLCTLGAILAPRGVSFLLVSHLRGRISKRPGSESSEGPNFQARLLRGASLRSSLRLCSVYFCVNTDLLRRFLAKSHLTSCIVDTNSGISILITVPSPGRLSISK